MEKEYSVQQPNSNQLEFRENQRLVIFKNEEEEIWENDKCIAGYEDIAGITFREIEHSEPKQYSFKIQLEQRVLVIAEPLQEAQAKEFANRLFSFLEIE